MMWLVLLCLAGGGDFEGPRPGPGSDGCRVERERRGTAAGVAPCSTRAESAAPAAPAAPAAAAGAGPGSGRASAAPPGPPADEWIAEDKLKHFFMSFAVTSFAYGGVRTLGLNDTPGLAAAAGAGAAAGVWKELRDRRAGEPFSFRDLAWDGLGVAAALVLLANTR